MSRAFVKEDASNERIIIPPRASLPAGTPNYVTPRGMALLEAELAELTAELERLQASNDDPQRARQLAVIHGRIEGLSDRMACAEIIDPHTLPQDEVGFGSVVTIRALSGKFSGEESRLTIVGVDEAELSEGYVAFVAPIARALLGCRIGEQAQLTTGDSEQLLEVVTIHW